MFSPKRTALYLAIGAMAFAASEANAGCKIISGSYVCATWIKGSEICQVTVDINGPNTSGTSNEPDNVSVTCEVMGGYFDSESEYACPNGDLPEGTLICETDAPPPPEDFRASRRTSSSSKSFSASQGNGKTVGQLKHDCKHADKNVGHEDPECIVSTNTTPESAIAELDDNVLSVTVPAHCNGNGVCTASAEILPPGDVCDEGTHLVDFTADAFLGHVQACDGGEGCEDLWQWCTLNGNQYDCTEVPDPSYYCD